MKENKLLNQKELLILEITNQLINWDRTVDRAVTILEENDQRFNQLRELDQHISDEELDEFNKKYKNNWLNILNMQQELLKAIQSEQAQTQQQLSQIDQKQKVVSNYMALKKNSIFIEKDY